MKNKKTNKLISGKFEGKVGVRSKREQQRILDSTYDKDITREALNNIIYEIAYRNPKWIQFKEIQDLVREKLKKYHYKLMYIAQDDIHKCKRIKVEKQRRLIDKEFIDGFILKVI